MDYRKQRNETSLDFHYNREERIKDRDRFKIKKTSKKRTWFFILLKVIGLVIFINLLAYLVLDDKESLPFSLKTKEMIFKEEILIEVNIKSKVEEEQELLIFLQKEDFVTSSQIEPLLPKEEKTLYFSLPYNDDKNYILIIEEGENKYSLNRSF